jgi:putative Mg2+ transporter-C (MgtC) family protein
VSASDQLLILLRIALAFALGGAIGLQRELSHEPAGLRTHMLVAGGAASFMALSIAGIQLLHGSPPVTSDRIAAQVITGIGFLGAGTIWRTPSTVRGLTTAASIWITAAVGMLCTGGLYILAVATAALTIVALAAVKIPERRLIDQRPGPDPQEQPEDSH